MSYHKTTITLSVLSEEPISEEESLGSIIENCDTGSYVGAEMTLSGEELTGKQMADALYEAGSDPGFFSLDDEGNSTDEGGSA